MNELEQMKQREMNYLNKFEEGAKEFLARITKNYNDTILLNTGPVDSKNMPDYTKGYLKILSGACSSLESFIKETDSQKDYPATLKVMRNNYRLTYLGLKSSKKTKFNDGQYQAAVDLCKGLDGLIQTAAGHDLNNLQNHQLQRASRRGS
jgi:hypothetical protein